MNSLDFGMVHTCKIIQTAQDQRLNFVSGSNQFYEGHPVTGSMSGASGTIKTVIIESGNWVSGDAKGYLILSFVSGSFKIGELLKEVNDVQAVVSGEQIPHTNGVGTPIISQKQTPTKCLFSEAYRSGEGIQNFESGDYVVKGPIVFLPATASIEEGDYILGDVLGFNNTYKVLKVTTHYRLFSTQIDHIEAELKAIEKRNG